MEHVGHSIDLGAAEPINEVLPAHIPSEIQADTLFTFMKEPEYLHTILQKAMISPRYCTEDISYLHIEGISRVSIPMKCFCDINLQRLEKHLACYGKFGIAFTKEWGMSKRIQQVQYINPASDLRRDYTAAFNLALKNAGTSCSETERRIKGLMLHLLMYLKPYSGKFENRVKHKVEDRCFTDECEWRYVPNLESSDFPPLYYDDALIRIGVPNDMSNAMARESELALSFDYSEVKHIIVPSRDEFRKLTAVIETLPIDNSVKYDLISKVIVWDEDRGDF